MKRKLLMTILTLTLALCSILGLTACGGNNENGNDDNPPHIHEFTTLKYDSTNHWFECSCGEKKDIENHKGGTATETSKAVCSVCEQEYGSLLIHSCNFVKQVVQDKYVKATAKCESKAQYYYSCACGEKGTTWFECGEELGHSYTNYVYNNDAKCEVDGTETAICGNGCGTSDIRAKIGTSLEHDFKEYIPDNNATYEEDGTKTATCSREGCNEKHTITDIGTKLESGIAFKTLSVNGTDVYGKVSNTTETFSFIDEVLAVGTAKFVVSLDIYGIQPVSTKTIHLTVGDNKVYVIEMIDDEPTNVYEVVVRRKPMFAVSFNSNGGTAVSSQTVEEDSFATLPIAPTRLGYTFDKWNYNFNTPITSDTTVTASWNANTNTPYKVEYYLENLEDENYTLTETANKTGTTDTIANAEINTFAHFTHKSSSTDSGNIAPNGATVLKVYYTRDKYSVTFNGNGGTLVSGNASQTVKYGGSVAVPTFTKTGYSLAGFDKKLTNVSESFTTNAKWQINQYTLTIVYGNGQENTVIKQDYNSEIGAIANPIERAGYDFIWDKNIPATMPAENLTITATWQSIFTLSGNTITGLTSYGENNYTELIIPSEIDGVSVTSIGYKAFASCDSLTSVTIANNVQSIGDYAFYDCSLLTSVEIGDSVTSIGGRAFEYCSSLTRVVIPDNVTSIGYHAFYDCSSLTSVKIGDSVISIGEEAFYNCSSLTNIVIPNSVTSIEQNAFYGCDSLTIYCEVESRPRGWDYFWNNDCPVVWGYKIEN